MLRINIISTCEIGYKNTLARMESVCTLRLGLSVLINNISYTKQSYVDDTLTIMPNMAAASGFLDKLNLAHSSVKFTMETESNGMLPFLGTQLLNRSPRIETKVYVKPTNSGLLLHFQSNVDNRYKNGLLRTMLDRAHRLSSSWSHFSDECDRLKSVFSRLKYPKQLVNSTIKRFVDSKVCFSLTIVIGSNCFEADKERALHSYFTYIPCLKKYSGQHSRCDNCAWHTMGRLQNWL